MTKQAELRMLKECLFYYSLPQFIIWIRDLFCKKYIDEGFCYYFKTFFNLQEEYTLNLSTKEEIIYKLSIPKSLVLSYIGSKYFDEARLYKGYWTNDKSKKKRLQIRIELLNNAIKTLKNELRRVENTSVR